MGMVVRTNTMAVNANRQLASNNTQVAKSLEKLSSGFRINRAGDDASGLAISEKMKAQIKGLDQASANSQDGISLVQTAEGNLNEVHDMLNRMVELAEKSANGILEQVDRDAIQEEMDALANEIDRIADSANFNNIKLFDGTQAGGAAAAAVPTVDEAGIKSGTATLDDVAAVKDKWTAGTMTQVGTTGNEDLTFTLSYKGTDGVATTKDITFKSGTSASLSYTAFKTAVEADADLKDLFTVGGAATGISFEAKEAGAGKGEVTGIAQKTAGANDSCSFAVGAHTLAGKAAGKSIEIAAGKNMAAGDVITVNGKDYTMAAAKDAAKGEFSSFADLKELLETDGVLLTGDNDDLDGGSNLFFHAKPGAVGAGGGLTLQIGDTNDAYNKLSITLDSMKTGTLFSGDNLSKGNVGIASTKLTASGVTSLDISDQTKAGTALKAVRNVVDSVSTQRGKLGALQNRLEHTINNLDVTSENMTSANSRIRDTDMAKEMMNYTKMNVLVQSAQAMLAQANQQPQSILQLLQ